MTRILRAIVGQDIGRCGRFHQSSGRVGLFPGACPEDRSCTSRSSRYVPSVIARWPSMPGASTSPAICKRCLRRHRFGRRLPGWRSPSGAQLRGFRRMAWKDSLEDSVCQARMSAVRGLRARLRAAQRPGPERLRRLVATLESRRINPVSALDPERAFLVGRP